MTPAYPALRDLLNGEIQRLQAQGRPFSQRRAATALNVAVSTFHDWLHGNSFPEDESKLDGLVKFFYGEGSTEESHRFQLRLKQLTNVQVREIRPADLRHRPVKFACFELPPFADFERNREPRAKGYLDRLLGRFTQLGDLKFDDTEAQTDFSVDVVQFLRDGRLDAGIGLYELLDRNDLYTIGSNCRMGVNAVIVEGDPVLDPDPDEIPPKSFKDITAALIERKPGDFTAVVGRMESEAGHTVLRNVVRYRAAGSRLGSILPATRRRLSVFPTIEEVR